jgi:hypothetical protein
MSITGVYQAALARNDEVENRGWLDVHICSGVLYFAWPDATSYKFRTNVNMGPNRPASNVFLL